MNRKILVLSFLTLISFSLFSQTERERPELRLSLAQARQYAIDNNRTLQNATLDVKQAYAERWQTIAQMLPQVDAKFDYQNMCGYKMELTGFSIPMNPNGNFGLTTSIAVNGQLVVAALLSNLAIEMQDLNRKNSELEVVTTVESLYMSALAMEKTVGLLGSSLSNLQDLSEMTQKGVDAGAVEQTSADQVKLQVARMNSTINSTKRSLELIYNSLALQLSTGADIKIVLTDELDNLLNVEAAIELLRQDFDVNNNYSYQLVKKNTELSKKNVLMAGMTYVPTISAFHQYSAKTYFGQSEGMNMTPPNVVGVSVSIPIWSSGKRAAGVTEKKLALQAAQNTQADTEDALKLQNKQLRYNLSSAYEDFDIQKLNIEVSQQVFSNTSKKFEQGYASSLELTDASTQLLTAQNNYVQSLLSLVNAHLELKKLITK